MMRTVKWIQNVLPDEPISKVAVEAVDIRLKIVTRALRLSAKKAHQDIEHVHQLRVATRRAEAVLRLFKDVLPRQRRQWIERRLKQIRRVAGDARDLDVLIFRLQRELNDEAPGGLGGIVQNLAQQRQRAQRPLVRTWRQMKKQAFSQKAKQLVKRVRWHGEGAELTFHELAVTTLRPLVDDFFRAGEANLAVPENLHVLRIAGKRLRYGLELLASGLDPIARTDVYPVLTDIQEILGEINDHTVAAAHFDCWLVQTNGKATTKELARLIGVERDSYRTARLRFDEWWTPETVARLKSQLHQVLDGDRPLPAIKACPA